jgi:phage/plasmid-associated DNA primase
MGDVLEIREEKPVMINICGPAYDSRYEKRWPNDGASETFMAKKLGQTYTQPHFDHDSDDDQALVSSMGRLWRCGPDSPLWHEITRYEAGQRMLRWDDKKHGHPGKEKTIKLSEKTYKAVYRLCASTVIRPEENFFTEAPHGFAAGPDFVRVDVEEGTISLEPLTAQHRVRAGHAIDCGVVLDLDDMTAFGRKGTRLHDFLSTIHQDVDAEEQEKRCLAMGQVAFAALTRTATHWHRALMAYGPPGTGKSQFLLLLHGLIPPEARCSITPQNLGNLRHTAKLEGKLLNACFETSADIMETATLKSAAMGEPIGAEPKYQDPFDFMPVALLAFAGNHLPRIRGSDPAVWYRWLAIQFDTVFRGSKDEVRDIGKKIAREELAEVVHWALFCGRVMLEQKAYTWPQCAEALTQQWKRESDPTVVWLDDRCDDKIDDASISSLPVSEWSPRAKLFRDFRVWSSDNDFGRMSSTTFYRRLADHGFETKRSNGRRIALWLKPAVDAA